MVGRRGHVGHRRHVKVASGDGFLIGAVEESLPHAETTSIGLEFGTVPLAEVLEAIRGDNWLNALGLRSGLSIESALARDIKTKIRDALPSIPTTGWRECTRAPPILPRRPIAAWPAEEPRVGLTRR